MTKGFNLKELFKFEKHKAQSLIFIEVIFDILLVVAFRQLVINIESIFNNDSGLSYSGSDKFVLFTWMMLLTLFLFISWFYLTFYVQMFYKNNALTAIIFGVFFFSIFMIIYAIYFFPFDPLNTDMSDVQIPVYLTLIAVVINLMFNTWIFSQVVKNNKDMPIIRDLYRPSIIFWIVSSITIAISCLLGFLLFDKEILLVAIILLLVWTIVSLYLCGRFINLFKNDRTPFKLSFQSLSQRSSLLVVIIFAEAFLNTLSPIADIAFKAKDSKLVSESSFFEFFAHLVFSYTFIFLLIITYLQKANNVQYAKKDAINKRYFIAQLAVVIGIILIASSIAPAVELFFENLKFDDVTNAQKHNEMLYLLFAGLALYAIGFAIFALDKRVHFVYHDKQISKFWRKFWFYESLVWTILFIGLSITFIWVHVDETGLKIAFFIVLPLLYCLSSTVSIALAWKNSVSLEKEIIQDIKKDLNG